MKKIFYVLLIAVIAVFGLTFGYKNHQLVEVNYYFGMNFHGSLPVLLLFTFAAGLVVGYGLALLNRIKVRRLRIKWQPKPRTEVKNDLPSQSAS